MNINMVVSLLLGAACYASGFLMERSQVRAYNNDINTGVDNAVYQKFGVRINEAKTLLDAAKDDAQKIFDTEIAATKSVVETNQEYVTAKVTIDANNAQINSLKKALKAAEKGNTTSVAVGNGNSSVAVSVKDTAQITQLQNDISNLQKETKIHESVRTRIWKQERDKISAMRTDEEKAIISRVDDAKKNYNATKFESELYKNGLKEDPAFMNELQKTSYLKNFSPVKKVISTILITLPLAASFAWIWKDAIKALKIYFAIKKGI